jgi:hypothetical protein
MEAERHCRMQHDLGFWTVRDYYDAKSTISQRPRPGLRLCLHISGLLPAEGYQRIGGERHLNHLAGQKHASLALQARIPHNQGFGAIGIGESHV